jgi:hypothetical protein
MEPENHLRFRDWQVHAVQSVVAGIREDLIALGTLITLEVTAFPEAPAFGTAAMAGHMNLDISSGQVQNRSGRRIPSSGFGSRLNLTGSFNYLRDVVSGGGPGWIRTIIPPFARQALCPIKLRGRISVKYEIPRSKRAIREESTGYCLKCKAQLSFCGKPFTADLTCDSCGAVNVYEESQQPVRLRTAA